LVEKLENTQIVKAIEEGFVFNKLAPSQKVDEKIVKFFKPANRYLGWDAEKIMNSIDHKIVSIKELSDLYADIDSSSVNITARLNNVYILLVLISVLMKKNN
jgi:hypothetical protein